MKYQIVLLFLFFVFCFELVYTQSITRDSLLMKNYPALKELYFKNFGDHEKARTVALAYLLKAKIEQDTVNIAQGYNYMARQFSTETNITYTDSIIALTKNYQDSIFPALGYSLKGYWQYVNGDYDLALDNYLISNKFAKSRKNIKQQLETGQAIANLKDLWGEHVEALELYKEHLHFIENQDNYEDRFNLDYLTTIYNLSLSYQRNNKIDSADIFINKGIRQSMHNRNYDFYNSFVFTSGVNHFLKREYMQARDSIEKSLPLLEPTSKAIAWYYLGKIDFEDDNDTYVSKFLKVDSIYSETNDEFKELRSVYESLINHFSNKSDTEKELVYIKKLLKADSILDRNREHLRNEIIKQYDKPRLEAQKIRLQNQLTEEINRRQNLKIIAFIIVLASLAIGFFQYFKKRIYKNRLDEITELRKTNLSRIYTQAKKKKINLKLEVVRDITSKLELFEKNEVFLKSDIKATNLAEDFETNSTYLSQVINSIKGQNFSQYINELRINYVIRKLREDDIIKKYTIKAIAREVGFRNTESFTKAFKKQTGVPISYFIENIK